MKFRHDESFLLFLPSLQYEIINLNLYFPTINPVPFRLEISEEDQVRRMLINSRARQKIGEDPQNQEWANDHSKFGFKMLRQMGWSQGKGLGKQENGMTSHLKISKKQINSGLGFNHDLSNNWTTHGVSFETILKRLNEDDGSMENDHVQLVETEPLKPKTTTVSKHRRSVVLYPT